ncbi:MAG TPA: hypothetical protein P5026_06050 [Kiritimatiellia bacterium]|nr:hypothetical protein [Kiritimatiellia bacterium]HRU71041.1 hypothetical protein [Kiritimatiellia bacterium]
MMTRFRVRALPAVVLFCAQAVLAFLPPSDKQEGVTLRIEGFVEQSTPERFQAEKVPADQPLAFTVTLVNERAEPVGGTVKVWLNDDWQIVGDDAFTLNAEPGRSASVSCTARAKPTVLNALYPIHARLALTLDGRETVLHPIAIFDAVLPAHTPAPCEHREVRLNDGVLRLDAKVDHRVFISQRGKTRELGVNFSGADAESGTHMSRARVTRGGIERAGFMVHPPYRGGAGETWNDFRLALPAGKPAFLNFFTAIRDSSPTEPPSDGTEHKVFVTGADGTTRELFSRFSASKVWEPAQVDLSAYAGQSITLRLWTGPGPKGNTTCDQCCWGDPVVTAGSLPALADEAAWQALERTAVARAREACASRFGAGSGTFRLDARGQRFGAAVALGRQGLTDGVFAFSDGTRDLIYRGFACDIDGAPAGGVENGMPVRAVETRRGWRSWRVIHRVATPNGTVPVRATLWAEGGALRVAWDMPGVQRDRRGTPRFTRLSLGAAQLPVWRVYAGFGNVIENPGSFTLTSGGFSLSTRHVGADYTNGLSLVQASDIFPDRLVHVPEARRFALETHHDAAFFFVPSAQGAFAAARAYRDVCGFEKGPGLKTLGGRMCIDQWSGDYREAAEGLRQAARYGVTDAVFVKHAWQRWGYDYRLPEIYPPAGGLEPFLEMRKAAQEAGMLFCPHDNYIDFYPDAEGYSYDHIVFDADGKPVRAWYNKGRRAQSYRWLPHAFTPWMTGNMRLMRDGFAPDSLFIDVFTAIAPFDYYDRAGVFYDRNVTQKAWRDAFDTCRSILKRGAPMISEAGTDALIGSLDAGQSDHFPASRWMKEFGESDRTPWHDMATHGKMVLFAGGLGPRYSALDWEKKNRPEHGYGSDDYLSNTVLGGRNPMCDGPFSRRTVMTYWLLHDVCAALAAETFESHRFGDSIYQQHTVFSGDCKVWANRGSNQVWTVANGLRLPQYGFYVQTPRAEAGVVLLDGQRAGFARSEKSYFADARPISNPLSRMNVESATVSGTYLGDGVFDMVFQWNVLNPPIEGYVPFLHICNDQAKHGGAEQIAFQQTMQLDPAAFKRAGTFTATARLAIPASLPAGDYRIRYGLYRPGAGDRMAIRGVNDGGHRIRGGVMTVTKSGNTFTSGTFTLETENENESLELNIAGKRLNFGPVATDGAFRLLHGERGAWTLIPLPGSRPFKAEITLSAFGGARARVKAVETLEAQHPAARAAEWSQDGDTLRLACDAQAFGYRIVFE